MATKVTSKKQWRTHKGIYGSKIENTAWNQMAPICSQGGAEEDN